ncbi:FAD-binding protein [Sulfurimonas autotrophica]|uniref:Succinate dehydrogenase subunit A n=1 Tax=Sulfurimonas autotrophica (strain ATCC BAA-671 / DSM 16294 / JCM 11897 / OK10) TaxID=563040 RepID=E0USR9_SULAO|nr:FAD-binding protein [Sulfurimonas autotrophica]ADN08096.1 succinate dehydrogenase subunit A [Sulfurimonas autotrophica DSM 16294]
MKTDVLIIGSGGAGLTAALAAKDAGADVRVITKEYPTRSQTCMAQGGMNAALGNVSHDSIEDHIQNTLKSAHGEADEEAVRYMCSEAPNAVAWLDEIGVCFSRTPEGKIAQRRLGGASAPRACYAQDYTGLKILHTLYERCLKKDVEMFSERYLVDLLTKEDGSICGALILNMRSGELEHHFAKCVVLASGGYSRIYDKYSTNSTASTGDGIAAASRAGAKLLGMEFVQFHPTGLKNSSILISESARGEGGYLLNSKGERFTNELAPRDEVSRAINEQIVAGEEVFLDIRHLGERFIDENLPQERKLALLYENVDPVKDLIPIKAVAHYTMGGIEVDNKSQTSVSGLFACGECANHKVHGANRLGGNSLLEIIVFGREAGKSAANFVFCDEKCQNDFDFKKEKSFLDALIEYKNEIDFYQKRTELGELFYKKVGIIRKESQLQEAKQEIELLKKQLPLMGVKDTSKVYNTNLMEFIEFRNMLDICERVVSSALARKKSCGAHFVVEE